MKKLKMTATEKLTLEEGCSRYLEDCRGRNLRDDTIRHYRQSYLYFYKFFDPKMPVESINEATYKSFVLYLKNKLDNDDCQSTDGDICPNYRRELQFVPRIFSYRRSLVGIIKSKKAAITPVTTEQVQKGLLLWDVR